MSPGKSRAWGRLLGTSAFPGAQRGWGILAATRLARRQDNKAQGTGPGFGFAMSEYGNQGFNQSAASGTAEMGFPNLWASPATGTGMTGLGLAQLATGNLGIGPPSALGATASGGPGQWANPTPGSGISGFSFAQPSTGHRTTGHRAEIWLCPTGISKSVPWSGYYVGHSGNQSPGSMG